ncbi:hypothetical protein RCU70_03755, partial [Escherichia marmotae]|nr:hypothetical protein [Escherichia marmotae]
ASYPTYESHRTCRPDKAFTPHPALIVGCDACASYPTYESHRTVGRIRRLRRIRHLLSDAMLVHLIRPMNRIEP